MALSSLVKRSLAGAMSLNKRPDGLLKYLHKRRTLMDDSDMEEVDRQLAKRQKTEAQVEVETAPQQLAKQQQTETQVELEMVSQVEVEMVPQVEVVKEVVQVDQEVPPAQPSPADWSANRFMMHGDQRKAHQMIKDAMNNASLPWSPENDQIEQPERATDKIEQPEQTMREKLFKEAAESANGDFFRGHLKKVGNAFSQKLRTNPKFKAAYAALDRNRDRQQAFRDNWAKEELAAMSSKRTKTDSFEQTDLLTRP